MPNESAAAVDSERRLGRVAVFCGSRVGNRPAYVEAAQQLGRGLAQRNIGIVYGGASVGLMGEVADSALARNGEVIGVIPEHLVALEVAHNGLTEQRVVPDMHVRKRTMMDLSDAFVALPGGAGTFEEWFEVFTWRMLGLHDKRCIFLNIENFYSPLLNFLRHTRDEGFITGELYDQIESFPDVASLLASF